MPLISGPKHQRPDGETADVKNMRHLPGTHSDVFERRSRMATLTLRATRLSTSELVNFFLAPFPCLYLSLSLSYPSKQRHPLCVLCFVFVLFCSVLETERIPFRLPVPDGLRGRTPEAVRRARVCDPADDTRQLISLVFRPPPRPKKTLEVTTTDQVGGVQSQHMLTRRNQPPHLLSTKQTTPPADR